MFCDIIYPLKAVFYVTIKVMNKTHWMTRTRIYKIRENIKTRCNNPNIEFYKNYWGRWIKCEWKSFEEFYNDMKEWYEEHLTIERDNVNWNYCKSNCCWATRAEQQQNTRKTNYKPVIQSNLQWIRLNEFESIKEAERKTGIPNANIRAVCKWKLKTAWWYKWSFTRQ